MINCCNNTHVFFCYRDCFTFVDTSINSWSPAWEKLGELLRTFSGVLSTTTVPFSSFLISFPGDALLQFIFSGFVATIFCKSSKTNSTRFWKKKCSWSDDNKAAYWCQGRAVMLMGGFLWRRRQIDNDSGNATLKYRWTFSQKTMHKQFSSKRFRFVLANMTWVTVSKNRLKLRNGSVFITFALSKTSRQSSASGDVNFKWLNRSTISLIVPCRTRMHCLKSQRVPIAHCGP